MKSKQQRTPKPKNTSRRCIAVMSWPNEPNGTPMPKDRSEKTNNNNNKTHRKTRNVQFVIIVFVSTSFRFFFFPFSLVFIVCASARVFTSFAASRKWERTHRWRYSCDSTGPYIVRAIVRHMPNSTASSGPLISDIHFDFVSNFVLINRLAAVLCSDVVVSFFFFLFFSTSRTRFGFVVDDIDTLLATACNLFRLVAYGRASAYFFFFWWWWWL